MSSILTIDNKGRLLLPKRLRERLGSDGKVFVSEVEEGILISTKDQVVEELQSMFNDLPKRVSLAEELIKERRQAAKSE